MIQFSLIEKAPEEDNCFQMQFILGRSKTRTGRIMFYAGEHCDYDDHQIEIYSDGCFLEMADLQAIREKTIEINHFYRTFFKQQIEANAETPEAECAGVS